eukprot:6102-Heterococcus_DN1.PRE.4
MHARHPTACVQDVSKHQTQLEDFYICTFTHDAFTEANEMLDEMKTLADYGITGSKHDNEAELVNIFYDFKPSDHDEPLLLAL